MNATTLQTLILLLLAYLAVFLAAIDQPLSRLLGTQIDLLPALMVYAGLNTSWPALTTTALLSGLWLDSLSSNPLGISVLPLFLVGFGLKWHRELILRDATYAQFILGGIATAIVPLATVLLLWSLGYKPVLGWNSLPQWLMKIVVGAAATPIFFWVLARTQRALNHPHMAETSFRKDREIKRGRA